MVTTNPGRFLDISSTIFFSFCRVAAAASRPKHRIFAIKLFATELSQLCVLRDLRLPQLEKSEKSEKNWPTCGCRNSKKMEKNDCRKIIY